MFIIHMYPFILTLTYVSLITIHINHPFNRSDRQQRRRDKKVKVGVIIVSTFHERWPTRLLQDTRGDTRKVPLRGRCVSCYVRDPVPLGRIKLQENNKYINIPSCLFTCDFMMKFIRKLIFGYHKWFIYIILIVGDHHLSFTYVYSTTSPN